MTAKDTAKDTAKLASIKLIDRLQVPLHLVTGKGGVGRSSFAIALGQLLASQGKRTLILEPADTEGSDSMLGRMLGVRRLQAEAIEVQPNLSIAALVAHVGHERFLRSLIPMKRLVKAALDSQALSRFLVSAPSMYELGIFYHLWLILQEHEYDHVVLDLPATGHTLALTQLPKQIERIIRKGKVVDALKKGSAWISQSHSCSTWIVTLPERLPVSEAIDLSHALVQDHVTTAGFVLNRVPRVTLGTLEEKLVQQFYQSHPQAIGSRSFERYQNLKELREELTDIAPVYLMFEESDVQQRVLDLKTCFTHTKSAKK
jgi:arsenite/tail-anchored protein-transporting ATPase